MQISDAPSRRPPEPPRSGRGRDRERRELAVERAAEWGSYKKADPRLPGIITHFREIVLATTTRPDEHQFLSRAAIIILIIITITTIITIIIVIITILWLSLPEDFAVNTHRHVTILSTTPANDGTRVRDRASGGGRRGDVGVAVVDENHLPNARRDAAARRERSPGKRSLSTQLDEKLFSLSDVT